MKNCLKVKKIGHMLRCCWAGFGRLSIHIERLFLDSRNPRIVVQCSPWIIIHNAAFSASFLHYCDDPVQHWLGEKACGDTRQIFVTMIQGNTNECVSQVEKLPTMGKRYTNYFKRHLMIPLASPVIFLPECQRSPSVAFTTDSIYLTNRAQIITEKKNSFKYSSIQVFKYSITIW